MPLCFFIFFSILTGKYANSYILLLGLLFHIFYPFFAAVALSVIDTSSSNFFAENWTQFPYSEFVAHTGVAGSGEEVLLESSDNNNQKKVNNAAVTVNSNKELQNPATSAISSSKETIDKVLPICSILIPDFQKPVKGPEFI